jgi:hypothetical protein
LDDTVNVGPAGVGETAGAGETVDAGEAAGVGDSEAGGVAAGSGDAGALRGGGVGGAVGVTVCATSSTAKTTESIRYARSKSP